MKNLKIKFRLFSLLAILTASVFLTSCEQQNVPVIEPEMNVSSENYEPSAFHLFPKGTENYSEDELVNYTADLSEQDLEKYAENARISEYLNNIGHWESIWNSMEQGQSFVDINLADYLSDVQMTELEMYQTDTNNIASRCWWTLIIDRTDNRCENDCMRYIFYCCGSVCYYDRRFCLSTPCL